MTDYSDNSIPFVMEGIVVDTNDPNQMGRLRVHLPSLDGEEYEIAQLPWCEYASPFMGFTVDYPHGANSVENHSHSAYGFWAIPKLGATVLVLFVNGDPTSRFYFASTPRMHRNRSLPSGRNVDFHSNLGPFGDAGDGTGFLNPLQPAFDNLRTQFQFRVTESEAITRGAYERQVAQGATDKDGSEGYSPNPADPSYLDPQTVSITSPGGHAIIMQDDPQFARLRIKTAEGHQVIFDDVNERIYMSSAKGANWVEMDLDGHINIFGVDSISMRSGKDFNIRADGDINFEAGGNVNIKAVLGDVKVTAQGSLHLKANKDTLISACGIFDMSSETSLKLTSLTSMDINAHTGLKLSGDVIDMKSNGATKIVGSPLQMNSGASKAEDASCPTIADSPTIVPGFEPWTRPVSTNPRGKNWQK